MKGHSLIRTIYLYLFALVGLTLLIIGLVRFVDMGLKAFVFKQAEELERVRQEYKHYEALPLPVARMEQYQEGGELSEEEKIALKQWLDNYQDWQEAEAEIDYLTVQRHKDASTNLAFILIGLPLYLYHWRLIRRD